MAASRGGSRCCIADCVTHSTVCRGLSYPKVPPKDTAWGREMLVIINRGDKEFNPDKARICTRHFIDDDLKQHGQGRSIKTGRLPTKELPQKSCQVPKPPPRKPPVCRDPIPDEMDCEMETEVEDLEVENPVYTSMEQIREDLTELPPDWLVIKNTDQITLGQLDQHQNMRYCVNINGLTAEVRVNSLHAMASQLTNTNITTFLNNITSKFICPGIHQPELQVYAKLPSPTPSTYFRHITNIPSGTGLIHSSTVRSTQCDILLTCPSTCPNCRRVQHLLNAKVKRREDSAKRPLKPKTPLCTVSQEKLKAAVKTARKKQLELEKEVERLKAELEHKYVEVKEDQHREYMSWMKEGEDKITNPLAKLFWEEQQKAFSRKGRGMRWHPMMIRLAILLRSRSPACYDTFRETGILKLPGTSTLRDYTNAIKPEEGFSAATLEHIKEETRDLQDHERYCVLLHDEMSIKEDLVFDESSGSIVGFVNPTNEWSESPVVVANHVLVFMVVGVNTSMKFSLAYFGTRALTSADLYPLLWQAVGYLEVSCNLKVIASTSDKASPNQRLYRLHGLDNEVCYKTINTYAPDRYLYFISDAPHLIKTLRNNIRSSGAGKTRYLWNNGHHLLWEHVVRIYNMEMGGLRRTKLTYDHINLTSFSVMSVPYAVQTLSAHVARAMKARGGEDCQETAKFFGLSDKTFDCFNGACPAVGDKTGKPELNKYDRIDDSRFEFLERDYLGYLREWKASVDARVGFTPAEKSRMFISHQTYEGLVMTIRAFIEAVQYLLQNGVKYVYARVFCQDPLEAHFGRHRGMGRRMDNPSLWAFGYQEQKIRLQRALAIHLTPRRYLNGKKRTLMENVQIIDEPLKRIKR